MNNLKPKTHYRIVIFNRGEELRVTFDLRVEIIERPKDIKLDQKNTKNIMPKSIDEIKRLKQRTEGLKESEFVIGTRFMMEWIEKNEL